MFRERIGLQELLKTCFWTRRRLSPPWSSLCTSVHKSLLLTRTPDVLGLPSASILSLRPYFQEHPEVLWVGTSVCGFGKDTIKS